MLPWASSILPSPEDRAPDTPSAWPWNADLIALVDLFGSVARGEPGPDNSDVDLLVDFEGPIGLFHFSRVQRRLEEILGCRVDLVTRDAVKRQLRDRIRPGQPK